MAEPPDVSKVESPFVGYEWQNVYDDSEPPVYLGTFLVPVEGSEDAVLER